MENQKEESALKRLIKFLNSKKGQPLVKSAIKTLYGENNGINKIKIDKLDKFFDIEYEIITAILNPGFKDELKNDNIITQFSDAKGELENKKNDNKEIQNELSSLIILYIDMGVILKRFATNYKVEQNKLIGSGDQNQKESIEFINICRIINRLIDNEYTYENKKPNGAFNYENDRNEREKLKMASAFMQIFSYNSYQVFWKYVAEIPNIESYIDRLNNSFTKFEAKECQKLQERFLKYKEVRKYIFKSMETNKCEIYQNEFTSIINPKLKIEKQMLRLIDIEDVKEPFSFWKIILLLVIVLAFGGTGFFGFNAWLAFITFITNFWSIIIALVALALFLILLVVAHKTGAFKVGKLFCCGKYGNDSWFYLRQGKEHNDKPKTGTETIDSELD